MLKCNPVRLSFGSSLPRRLRILIIESFDERIFGSQPQLCVALRGLPALERLSLVKQDLRLNLAPLLAALQHCTLLTNLNIDQCNLPGLPEG